MSLKTHPPEVQHRRISWYQLLVTGLVLTTVIGFLGCGILQLWVRLEVVPDFLSAALWLGVALAVICQVGSAYGWALILESVGNKVEREYATRVWLLSEAWSWLPGDVLGHASRSSMAPRIGISIATASASKCLELIILFVASGLVSLPGAWLYSSMLGESLSSSLSLAPPTLLLSMGILVIPVGLLLGKRLREKVAVCRDHYRSLREMQLHRGALLRSILFYSTITCLSGVATGCLANSLPLGNIEIPLSAAVAATALAWIVGRLAVFAPEGLVVRESMLAMLLMPWIPFSAGFTLAILARLVQIFGEVVSMIWVVLSDRWRNESVVPAPLPT